MADDSIRVSVVRFGDRKNLMLRYTDPATGRVVHKSAGTSNKREAERAAGRLQQQLEAGGGRRSPKMDWSAFVDLWETQATGGLSPSTVDSYRATINVFERPCRAAKLADVTSPMVSACGVASGRRRARCTGRA